ncbi:hypothetical protein V2J09_020803 [Rumex salicifolius]
MKMEKEQAVEHNRREDLRWLLSLSESEIELLISLKKLVIQRAKVIGHGALAEKFNIKMLRVLGFIVMQHAKNQIKDLSIPGLSESAALLNASNLLNCDLKVGVNSDGDLEVDKLIDQRKRKISRSSEHSSSKRLKSTVTENS